MTSDALSGVRGSVASGSADEHRDKYAAKSHRAGEYT